MKIPVLAGGVRPEVIAEAARVLEWFGQHHNLDIRLTEWTRRG